MSNEKRQFPKKPISNSIDALHINSARQMHQLTTSARIPRPDSSSSSSSSTTSNRPAIPLFNSQSRAPFARPSNPTQKKSPSNEVSVPAKGHEGKCTNPQCAHCGAVIIPSPSASFPLENAPSISINDWSIYSKRNPILNCEEIEILENILKIPVPEMIFGNNLIRIEFENKFKIEFNANDALKLVQLNPENLIQVSYATDWLNSRAEKHKNNDDVILEMYKPFDWTYTTNYKGTLLTGEFIKDDSKTIPLDKLKKQDPILFFDDMILYEDELGDNGISILNVKVRVMHSCMLLLQRLFIRVDNVLLRVQDTRLYIDFEDKLVIREYKKQELDYNNVLKTCHGSDPRSLLRDMNWCASRLPVVSVEREYIQF